MQKRAEALGFQPASPEDITYVVVPGYAPTSTMDISESESASPDQRQNLTLQFEYTESLFDWIARALASSAYSGGQP
jgi:hypothetical protein